MSKGIMYVDDRRVEFDGEKNVWNHNDRNDEQSKRIQPLHIILLIHFCTTLALQLRCQQKPEIAPVHGNRVVFPMLFYLAPDMKVL